jgi:hypothetical protein
MSSVPTENLPATAESQPAQTDAAATTTTDSNNPNDRPRNTRTNNASGRGRGRSQQPVLAPPSRPKPIRLHDLSGVPMGHVPAYLPGSASLVEELDRRLLIVLRDGKHIVGVRTL